MVDEFTGRCPTCGQRYCEVELQRLQSELARWKVAAREREEICVQIEGLAKMLPSVDLPVEPFSGLLSCNCDIGNGNKVASNKCPVHGPNLLVAQEIAESQKDSNGHPIHLR